MRKFAAAVTMLASLGGCHSIFGHQAKLEIQPVGSTKAATAVMALKEGRAYLRSGEPGLALASLQTAAADPATLADAHNALGVAYAMLGRGDLAERYFRQAMAESPTEPKYAANLARFYSSRDAALAQAVGSVPSPVEPVVRTAAEQPMERTIQAGPGVVRVTAPLRQVAATRLSSREIAIRTVEDRPPPSADGRRRNPAFASAGATTRPERQAYPVRIELASVGGGK